MGLRDLLTWYQMGDRSRVDLASLREMVAEALAHPDPGLTWEERRRAEEILRAASMRLFSQEFPAEEFDLLAAELGARMGEGPSVADSVDGGLRELAAGLAEAELRTESVVELEAALALAEGGDLEAFDAALQALETRLLGAWEAYEQSPVAGFEVTVEAVVGHRLLLEGLQGWIDGLEYLRAAAAGEAEMEEGLARIDAAQRLLLALQRQQEGLEARLRARPSC